MSFWRWTSLLVAGALSPIAAGAQVVSIAGRTECDTSKYHDLPVALTDVVDSAAIMPLLLASHLPPPDAFDVSLRIFPDSQVELRVIANRHSAAERDSLARAIRPHVRHPIAIDKPLDVSIDVLDNPALAVSLSPGAYTCLSTVRNAPTIHSTYDRGIHRLREEGTLPQEAHGLLVVGCVVLPDGNPDRIAIDSSSGIPGVDSVAVAAMRVARFRPAVIGRAAVTIAARQRFSF